MSAAHNSATEIVHLFRFFSATPELPAEPVSPSAKLEKPPP